MALFHGPLLDRDNPTLRRLLTENVPETLWQLIDMGIVFFGPMPEPPHRVARMHNVLPNSKSYAYHLGRRARKLGVDIWLKSRARELISENGVIKGIECEGVNGPAIKLYARNGVVLAGGDFSNSRDLKGKYCSADILDADAIVTTSTGDGHRLALKVGAEIINGDLVSGPQIRFVPPPINLMSVLPPHKPLALAMRFALNNLPSWILRPFILMFATTILEPQKGLYEAGAILINKNGERFTDECDGPQLAVPSQPDKIAYILIDDDLAKQFSKWPHYISTAPGVAYAYIPDYRRNRKDVYHIGSSLEDLARKIGAPADKLSETVTESNAALPTSRKPLIRAPFHALGPVKSWIGITEGGLRITPQFEVLHRNGSVIPGLFAAGGNGQGGIILEGHGHHLGWAFTSGRLAGRQAAFFDRSTTAADSEQVPA